MSLQMDVDFVCSCGEYVEETVFVQPPDFSAEKNKDSQTDSWDYIFCGACEKEYEVQIANSFYTTTCSMVDGDITVRYGIPYYPEDEAGEISWEMASKLQIDIFASNIENAEKIMSIDLDKEIKFSLLVMLHAHIVASVESYLSSTFIHKVLNSEELIRKLVETDPTFSKRTFSLKEIFEEQDKLKITVGKYLKDLIFHDLKKIKPMYSSVFSYNFGDISWLFNAVSVRHHCVHRAGYDKEGEKVEISEETLKELIRKSKELVENIEKRAAEISEEADWPF